MLLDPESEQVRDVYAHFGLAVYWGQCIEQSIFQYLLFFDHFPKAIAKFTTPESWANDFDRYEAREMSQTMGKLIRRLQEVGQQVSNLEHSLFKVLKIRNWLAHGYFADRAIEFTDGHGRSDMISELEEIKESFQLCAQEIDAITLPVMQKFGLNEEMLTKIQADMRTEYVKRSRNSNL